MRKSLMSFASILHFHLEISKIERLGGSMQDPTVPGHRAAGERSGARQARRFSLPPFFFQNLKSLTDFETRIQLKKGESLTLSYNMKNQFTEL